MAAPYKEARPCSDLADPPLLPLLGGNLSRDPPDPLPGNPTRREVGGAPPVGAGRRGGCPPPLKTFNLLLYFKVD